jgi:adenosylmethionine---8-amino-7-oxononanoate aminotransferase
MSFHYWRNRGRPEDRFVASPAGYHGETLGALAVTDVALFRDTYAPLLRAGLMPSAGLAPRATGRERARRIAPRAARARGACSRATTRDAALIVEPLVQGASGMAMHDPALPAPRARAVHALRRAADRRRDHDRLRPHRHDVRVRAGGIAPDLMCLSKGITGGYLPLSVRAHHRRRLRGVLRRRVTRGFLHSHSYTGNALACRAALAVLDIFERDDVIAPTARRRQRFLTLAAPLARDPRVRDFRNLGMIWAFEVRRARPRSPAKAFAIALARGVLLRPIGNTCTSCRPT